MAYIRYTKEENMDNQMITNGGCKCPKCGGERLQVVSDVKGKGVSFWKVCLCGILGLLMRKSCVVCEQKLYSCTP